MEKLSSMSRKTAVEAERKFIQIGLKVSRTKITWILLIVFWVLIVEKKDILTIDDDYENTS